MRNFPEGDFTGSIRDKPGRHILPVAVERRRNSPHGVPDRDPVGRPEIVFAQPVVYLRQGSDDI